MKYVLLLVAVLAPACSTSTVVGPSPTPAPIITPAPQPTPQPVIVLPTLLVGLRVTGYDQTSSPHSVGVAFTTEINDGPATYAFDFGDGTSTLFPGTSPTTAHQYPLTGRWTVTVIAYKIDGRTASASVTITTPPCQTFPSPGCR